MHTQIVLCPGINDGDVLERTVSDLYRYSKHIVSLAIVPVGLTDHRFGLADLKKVDRGYACDLLSRVERWEAKFRKEIGRGFVYASDEFYIVAGQEVPGAAYYDGFPQTENGVGLVRSFLQEFRKQARRFPARLPKKRRLVMVTGSLASIFIKQEIAPRLRKVTGLDVEVVIAPNLLFGESVTVAGLLSAKCIYSAVNGIDCGNVLLLPPDILNAEGMFLDDATVPELEARLGVPVIVFDGRWSDVFLHLKNPARSQHAHSRY
jgi:putative radical SAM enzyme (TIGR03279 family)